MKNFDSVGYCPQHIEQFLTITTTDKGLCTQTSVWFSVWYVNYKVTRRDDFLYHSIYLLSPPNPLLIARRYNISWSGGRGLNIAIENWLVKPSYFDVQNAPYESLDTILFWDSTWLLLTASSAFGFIVLFCLVLFVVEKGPGNTAKRRSRSTTQVMYLIRYYKYWGYGKNNLNNINNRNIILN